MLYQDALKYPEFQAIVNRLNAAIQKEKECLRKQNELSELLDAATIEVYAIQEEIDKFLEQEAENASEH